MRKRKAEFGDQKLLDVGSADIGSLLNLGHSEYLDSDVCEGERKYRIQSGRQQK